MNNLESPLINTCFVPRFNIFSKIRQSEKGHKQEIQQKTKPITLPTQEGIPWHVS